jgi:hypothetical protein
MRLTNKTNVETAKLKQFGLVDQHIGVDTELVKPGGSVEIAKKDQARVEAEHKHLFEVGALAWDEPVSEQPVEVVTEGAPPAPPQEAAVEALPGAEETKPRNALVDMDSSKKEKNRGR